MNQRFWSGRSVLVTGATGLLGGWMIKELLGLGAEIVALVRDGRPDCMLLREGIIDEVRVVSGDLSDLDLLRRTLCEYEVDTVFHLAAQTLVNIAKRDPIGTLEANVRGTWNLLESSRQAGTRQIIVASSDKAYGIRHELPYTEDHPLCGTYPYDVSKSCADLICGMYAATYEVPVCVTRCGNLFGGGDLNFSRTIPGLLRATFSNERFLIRSDGRFVRDFLYVRDAVHAYLLLAEKLASDRTLIGQAFNFSLEMQLTVLDLVHEVLRLVERPDLQPEIQNIASAEIRQQYLSAEKARRLLGWAPQYGMERGLLETIHWYRRLFEAKSNVALRAAG
jgi:CDP-glucose 4,6-dehydratase